MHPELSRALPRLASFNPYVTDDLDAAREHISSLFVPHRLDIVGCRQVLDVCISRAEIDDVSLIYHRHGARVSVRPQVLEDFFLLQIPICGEAFVNTRALFAGFQSYLNTTPMRYLKDLRLDMVHEALSSTEPRRASVTPIAMNYGFLHLGHFCAAYKQRFGELPRETLCH